MDMLRQLDADHKIARVYMKLDSENEDEWDDEIVRTMIHRYQNVYYISLEDSNDSVDNHFHSLIQSWII